MPTYEYVCRECGEHLEVVQSFHDEPLETCPSCGGGLRKVFGSIGIVFKGSGFYKTDSRRGGSTSTSASPTPAPASGSASGASPTGSSSGSSDASGSAGSAA